MKKVVLAVLAVMVLSGCEIREISKTEQLIQDTVVKSYKKGLYDEQNFIYGYYNKHGELPNNETVSNQVKAYVHDYTILISSVCKS